MVILECSDDRKRHQPMRIAIDEREREGRPTLVIQHPGGMLVDHEELIRHLFQIPGIEVFLQGGLVGFTHIFCGFASVLGLLEADMVENSERMAHHMQREHGIPVCYCHLGQRPEFYATKGNTADLLSWATPICQDICRDGSPLTRQDHRVVGIDLVDWAKNIAPEGWFRLVPGLSCSITSEVVARVITANTSNRTLRVALRSDAEDVLQFICAASGGTVQTTRFRPKVRG